MQITDRQHLIYKGRICPYCGRKSTLMQSSEEVYGVNFGPLLICKPCWAWVGLHNDGKAKGRLANKNLREQKIIAHFHFDKIWMSGKHTRKNAYRLLSEHLGVPAKYTHIGMFSIRTCRRVIDFSRKIMSSKN